MTARQQCVNASSAASASVILDEGNKQILPTVRQTFLNQLLCMLLTWDFLAMSTPERAVEQYCSTSDSVFGAATRSPIQRAGSANRLSREAGHAPVQSISWDSCYNMI